MNFDEVKTYEPTLAINGFARPEGNDARIRMAMFDKTGSFVKAADYFELLKAYNQLKNAGSGNNNRNRKNNQKDD